VMNTSTGEGLGAGQIILVFIIITIKINVAVYSAMQPATGGSTSESITKIIQ
jgi:hypothetical protein